MQDKTFRLFISSTFSDFVKEREILQTNVFPKIDEYCSKQGYQFQPIDLRWGINEEAQLDQKTLDLCLNEVDTCKYYPHPNFLIMLGDRYGWVPLPYMINKEEFEQILSKTNSSEKEQLLKWYRLDLNQLPISYILQERKDPYNTWENWEKEENILRDILQTKVNELDFSKEKKEKYFLSATEQEVIHGICDYKYNTSVQDNLDSTIDKEYIYGFIRKVNKKLDNDVKEFRETLKETLLSDNIYENKEDIYLEEFAKYIEDKLKHSIDKEINKIKEINSLEVEINEHKKFKEGRLKVFEGRDKTLSKIDSYIQSESMNPLIVYGPSGMGKSALIAKAIDTSEKNYKDSTVVYRFVGATSNSANIRELLISIINQLEEKELIETVDKFEDEEFDFYQQINSILLKLSLNDENKIVIFIDALDQFIKKEYLQWLPNEISNNLKIVISILNDENYQDDSHYYELFKNRMYEESSYINILDDSIENVGETILDNSLLQYNRSLQHFQKEYVLQKFKESNSSPLFLKIALEEIKNWKSWESTADTNADQDLSSGVRGVTKEYLSNLISFYNHEKLTIDKVLSYILYSKDGLSEKELLNILSEDLEDEQEFKNAILNEFHNPMKSYNLRRQKEEHTLPLFVWVRLYEQLKPFLITKSIDNQSLMKFFHREFTTVIEEKYNVIKEQVHTKLASYFLSLQDTSETWTKRYLNPRIASETHYHLFHAKKANELKELLFNLEYAGAVYDYKKHKSFLETYQKADTLDGITEDEIYPWESFYREQEHLILHGDSYFIKTRKKLRLLMPYQNLFQLAFSDGVNSPLRKEAIKLLENDCVKWVWIRKKIQEKMIRNGLLKYKKVNGNIKKCYKINEKIILIQYLNMLELYNIQENKIKKIKINDFKIDFDHIIVISEEKVIFISKVFILFYNLKNLKIKDKKKLKKRVLDYIILDDNSIILLFEDNSIFKFSINTFKLIKLFSTDGNIDEIYKFNKKNVLITLDSSKTLLLNIKNQIIRTIHKIDEEAFSYKVILLDCGDILIFYILFFEIFIKVLSGKDFNIHKSTLIESNIITTRKEIALYNMNDDILVKQGDRITVLANDLSIKYINENEFENIIVLSKNKLIKILDNKKEFLLSSSLSNNYNHLFDVHNNDIVSCISLSKNIFLSYSKNELYLFDENKNSLFYNEKTSLKNIICFDNEIMVSIYNENNILIYNSSEILFDFSYNKIIYLIKIDKNNLLAQIEVDTYLKIDVNSGKVDKVKKFNVDNFKDKNYKNKLVNNKINKFFRKNECIQFTYKLNNNNYIIYTDEIENFDIIDSRLYYFDTKKYKSYQIHNIPIVNEIQSIVELENKSIMIVSSDEYYNKHIITILDEVNFNSISSQLVSNKILTNLKNSNFVSYCGSKEVFEIYDGKIKVDTNTNNIICNYDI